MGTIFYKDVEYGGGNEGYTPNDAMETDLQDNDYVPFYDSSATAKKNTLWSNIKAKLKSTTDGIATNTVSYQGSNLVTSGGVHDALPHFIYVNVTAYAGYIVRLPHTGSSPYIKAQIGKVFIPVADAVNGRPVKFSNMSVNTTEGYITITLAEAVSAVNIGVLIVDGKGQ